MTTPWHGNAVHIINTVWSWWRHQMETFSTLLAICAGNSPVPGEFPDKSQWRGALVFSLICVWINGWVNNGEAGDLRLYRAHYDVTVMWKPPVTMGQQCVNTDVPLLRQNEVLEFVWNVSRTGYVMLILMLCLSCDWKISWSYNRGSGNWDALHFVLWASEQGWGNMNGIRMTSIWYWQKPERNGEYQGNMACM